MSNTTFKNIGNVKRTVIIVLTFLFFALFHIINIFKEMGVALFGQGIFSAQPTTLSLITLAFALFGIVFSLIAVLYPVNSTKT